MDSRISRFTVHALDYSVQTVLPHPNMKRLALKAIDIAGLLAACGHDNRVRIMRIRRLRRELHRFTQGTVKVASCSVVPMPHYLHQKLSTLPGVIQGINEGKSIAGKLGFRYSQKRKVRNRNSPPKPKVLPIVLKVVTARGGRRRMNASNTPSV
ncbi:hypothetical protein T190_22530 [Sinorhizobium meliloti CCBAU 01290]|nr:hypothetical protein T190_22530 [Sinorhizobium meliloti CCBAU 01290]